MNRNRFEQVKAIMENNTILLPSNMKQLIEDIDEHFEEYKNYFKDDYPSSFLLDSLHNKSTIEYK